jgi:dienelactone hydrolase
MDPRIKACICYFLTDIHSSLGNTTSDSSLRANDIQGELLMIFGKQDTHIPLQGRNVIKTRLDNAKRLILFICLILFGTSFCL